MLIKYFFFHWFYPLQTGFVKLNFDRKDTKFYESYIGSAAPKHLFELQFPIMEEICL